MNKFYHVPIVSLALLAKTLRQGMGRFICSIITLLLIITTGVAQPVSFTGPSYTQDFQSMTATALTAANVSQTTMLQVSAQPGGGTVTGWYLYHQENGTPRWGRSNGSSNTGSFFGMYDGAGTPNRALGSQGSQDIIAWWGIVIQNNTGSTINSLTISYDAVINRNPSTTVNPYPMSYRVSATGVASGTSTGAGTFNDAAGTWTAGTGFTTPSSGTGAPGSQNAISPLFRIGGAAITQTLNGLNLANGQYLYIRWKETDNMGSDATAGVDNFSIAGICAAPTITAPAAVATTANSGCTATGVSLGTTVTTAPCGLQSVTNNAPAAFPLGTTTVTWTITDNNGTTATATQDVTVTDTEPPTITAPAAVIATTNTGCTATGIDPGTPVTADNCSVASVTNDAPAAFPVGTTTVTWTVTDGSGNTATTTQSVTVTDTELPTITAPSALTVGTSEGCTATGINLGMPVTADNCSVDTIFNNAPSAFPLGLTTVTWTVVDESGNTATATQSVTVNDTLVPGIYLQGNSILAGLTGSSTTQTPYLIPSKPGVKFKSILSVNDVVGGYRMVGLPDGLGAFDNGNGTFTVLMNHELNNAVGITRAHGSKGTFVSKWIINKSDLSVVSGSDLMQQLYLWNPATSSFSAGTLALSRFCSADLPPVSAFYNSASGLGTTERIFMNGEESGAEGKAVGHIVTGASAGVSYELPYLGKFAWENSVASPASGNKTLVAGMDDGGGGQVYMYVGNKTNSGTDIDKAGLNNGKLYGIKVTGMTIESNGGVPAVGTRFEMADLGFVQNKTGATLETESVAAGVTTFFRPEDGAWDPKNPNDFYFVTTNAFSSPTRLWRLRFDNVTNPETGGTIEAVLDGTEGGKMFDNISVDGFGKVILQEDVGNNVHIGKIWQYTIATDALTTLARHDSTRFISGAANFLTQDEEGSGVIDVSDILGNGMYLMTDQAHYTPASNATEVVEGGQLLVMYNPYAFGTSTAADTIRVTSTGTLTPVDLGTPATVDNCNVASVTNDAPSAFPVDTTIVTWTVTDGSGNTATATQVVIVTDTEAPSITAPAAITVSTNEGCTAAGIDLGTPTVADNNGIDTVFNNAPSAFPLGLTTVTWTVVDSSGNTATATQSVTVNDTLAPAIYLQGSSLLAGITGSSTTQTPYLKPSKPGIKFTSILSVNDVAGSYRMAGLADGLGAFDNGNGTFTALVNHEIPNSLGITRAHGSKGAFVSKWIINKSDLSVVSGSDLMQQVYLWNPATSTFNLGTMAFSRFCSADLPAVSAFYNSSTGLGTTERIFMNGEESGTEGKGVGHIVTGPSAGVSYELPYLGKFAWENAVASPASGNKTVVVGLDDGTGGQVYFYIGTKTNTGTDIDKAGLNNGKLFGVKVAGLATEVNGSTPAAGTRFDLYDLGFVQNKTGVTLNTESIAAGVTTFLRPEDGAWDPSNPNDFYFVTTNGFNNPTRLWRLRFDNIATPETGGTIEAVLDGTEAGGQQMYDNIAVSKGQVYIQEDPGNQAYIARIWQYTIANDSLKPIAYHDSTRFISGAPNFLTQDEESSGIIDVSDILGQGMFLVADQAHYAPAANTAEVVEGGQLLVMYNPYAFGTSTAADTIRVTSTGTLTPVDLGTPATVDNCNVASVTNDAPSAFPVDTTIVTWTVTDGSGNTATATQVVIVSVAANQPPVVTITSPSDNSTFPVGAPITLEATATDEDGTITKVEFYDNGVKFLTDSTAPYGYTASNIAAGEYVITAKAFDNNGDSTVSDTVRVTVAACEGSGSIVVEGFTNIPGPYLANLGSDPDYPNNPDVTLELNKFEYGPNLEDNYGARVRGYICAPETGYYTFYLASNDHSDLYLSTDDNYANATRIAFVQSSAVGFRAYTANPSQVSVPIRLIKGVRYYIETIHKEGIGQDHLSVGWVLPNGVFEAPIPGSRLSPFSTPSSPLITSNVSSSSDFGTAMRSASARNASTVKPNEQLEIVSGLEVIASPNPSSSYFTLRIRSNSEEKINVVLTDAAGRTVENKTGVPSNGTVQIGSKLASSGMYIAEVQQGGKKVRIKLIKQ